jgi:hypothetical protein
LHLQEEYIKTIDASVFCKEKSNLGTQICQEKIICLKLLVLHNWKNSVEVWEHRIKQAFGYILRSDFIVECVDDNFGFSRYAERLGQC